MDGFELFLIGLIILSVMLLVGYIISAWLMSTKGYISTKDTEDCWILLLLSNLL